ncbi:Hydrolase in polyol utilization gene cluster [Collimonas arenae]|uniref:Hydrolase in polyol utilization gene cluster n=1 Tax=Collimonas arenae TaxID=279058 RepID=A0A0A1FGY5_9BURK|nr:HAD-IA family hydrolase [Collimonas arenae]AIY42874.1 Hydrolase in polyol utilization gene cluster [Collimonas arenae]
MKHTKNKHITHLICDCDGVLLDSESIALTVLHRQLASYLPHSVVQGNGQTELALHSAISERLGMMTNQLLDEISAQFDLGLLAPDYSLINMVVSRACSEEVTAVPGVIEVLATIPLPKAVASNSSLQRIDAGLRRCGLLELFEGHIHSGHDMGTPKPAPDVYLAAAAGFKAPPQQCIAIDDSVTGVRSAVAAGIRVFGFTGVAHDRDQATERLLAAGAELVFHDMQQLPRLLAA